MENNTPPPLRTMQKAQEEWLEYEEATIKTSRMSTEEIGNQTRSPQQQKEIEGIMRIRFTT